ncbi:hypothetical protein ACMD2_17827 [Ananas comosus]|uniref:Epidermal patterning factor-like protein n=1 Tax=Ananas comosus TaxID=4615 RepID=A0A199VYY3_ANACO|nr:hypothetical protein ACMD2_17827 [Ananas comosus]
MDLRSDMRRSCADDAMGRGWRRSPDPNPNPNPNPRWNRGVEEGIGERGVDATREETTPLIGSAPPKCDTKCLACGHCEAIEVPEMGFAQKHLSAQLMPTQTTSH